MTIPLHPGLRERQKAARRQAISDAATALFMERGFEAVTIAEVAEAAGVSIKTIFNYFGSKEELFLDREAEARRATLSAVADRPAGARITDGLRALLVEQRVPSGGDGWESLADPARYAGFRRFLETWTASPALRARHMLGEEVLGADLAAAIAAETGRPADDDCVRAMAAMLVAAMHLRHETLARAVMGGRPPGEVRRLVEGTAREAMGRVAAAFPELDVARRPPDPDGDPAGAGRSG